MSETNKQTVEELKGTTAALTELAREIRGVRSTTDEHYALGKIIHEKTEATNTLVTDDTRDILTKLNVLIGAINTQSRRSRKNDRLIHEIRQTQWWLHIRLQTQFPQLALPAPATQDNGTIAVA